jgi:integrase
MLMAKAKADPRTVQGILGHADIVTALRVYTHFVHEDAVRTARDLDRLLGSGGQH